MTGATQSGRQAGASPRRTFALVVAADCYEMTDPVWDLPHSLSAARRIVGWLRGNSVPEGNIHFFSGGKECPDLKGVISPARWKRATYTNLNQALTEDLSKGEGDLLLVFWSGHGAMSRGEWRLYLPEMTDGNTQNVEAARLRMCLRTTAYRYSEQAVVIEACAWDEGTPLDDPLPFSWKGRVYDVPRYSFFVAPGNKSEAGVIGTALAEELEKERFPLALDAVCERMGRRRIPGLKIEPPEKTVSPRASSGLGSKYYVQCDRGDAAKLFYREAEQHSSRERRGPMVTLVYGDEEERPDCLVDRFLLELREKHDYYGEHFVTGWDTDDETGTLRELWEQARIPAGLDHSAAVRRFLQARKEEPVILIRHMIGKWGTRFEDTLKKYVRLWEGCPPELMRSPVFVFLDRARPPAEKDVSLGPNLWRGITRFFPRSEPKDATLESFRSVASQGLCHLIGPDVLGPVERGEFDEFHAKNRLRERGHDLYSVRQRIFGTQSKVPMRRVVDELIKVSG